MKQQKIQPLPPPSLRSIIVFWIISVAATIFIGIGFFYWTVIPYMQAEDYILASRQANATGDFSSFLNNKFIFNPDSNVQGILRGDFLRLAKGQYVQGHLDATNPALINKAIAEMEEYLSRHPSYYTYVLSLADAYGTKAHFLKDPASQVLAESYYKKDLEVINHRQDVIFSYAVSLFETGREKEAFAMLREVIARNPDSIQAHYQLARFLSFSSDTSAYDEAFTEYEITLDHYWESKDWVANNAPILKEAYQKFLSYYYKKNDFDKFYQVVYRLTELDPDQKYAYLGVMENMKANHKIPVLNLVDDSK